MNDAMLALRPSVSPLSMVRPVALLRFVLLGLLIGNLGRIPVFSTGDRNAVVMANDVLLALALFVGGLAVLERRSLRLDRVALTALVFALIGAGSALFAISRFGLSAFELFVSLSYLARWLFYFGLYVVMINLVRLDDVDALWNALEMAMLIFAVFGIVQALTMPNFAQLVYPNSRVGADWDAQGNRLVSTWLDPVFAGGFLGIGLVMQMAQIAVGRRVAWWKPTCLAIALVLTLSRGSILATLAGLFIVLLIRGASIRLWMAVGGVALLIVAGAPIVIHFTEMQAKYTVDVSGLQRLVAWLRAWRVFSEHPVLGVGFNTWGFVQERYGYRRTSAFTYSLDGGFIFIALLTGLVGLAVYAWIYRQQWRRARAIWRDTTKSQRDRGLAIGVAGMTAMMPVHSLFVNSLLHPFFMETMWFLWGLLFVVARGDTSGERHVVGDHGALPQRSRVAVLEQEVEATL